MTQNEIGIDQDVLLKFIERNADPILIINPTGEDIYSFLATNKETAKGFGFPNNIEQKTEIITSIRDYNEEKRYALVMSGIYGYEVDKIDIGKDYSTNQALDLFRELSKKEVPVATLTLCCAIGPLRELDSLTNLLFYGARPTDFRTFSYIFNCYAKGEILPIPEIKGTNGNAVGIFDERERKRMAIQNALNWEEVGHALGFDKLDL